jgi:hypothetical protein
MDWFDDDAYRHFDTLDAAGLAWECLRRNAQYRQEVSPDCPWQGVRGCLGPAISRSIRICLRRWRQ